MERTFVKGVSLPTSYQTKYSSSNINVHGLVPASKYQQEKEGKTYPSHTGMASLFKSRPPSNARVPFQPRTIRSLHLGKHASTPFRQMKERNSSRRHRRWLRRPGFVPKAPHDAELQMVIFVQEIITLSPTSRSGKSSPKHGFQQPHPNPNPKTDSKNPNPRSGLRFPVQPRQRREKLSRPYQSSFTATKYGEKNLHES
jgi:hypothetical protein